MCGPPALQGLYHGQEFCFMSPHSFFQNVINKFLLPEISIIGPALIPLRQVLVY